MINTFKLIVGFFLQPIYHELINNDIEKQRYKHIKKQNLKFNKDAKNKFKSNRRSGSRNSTF